MKLTLNKIKEHSPCKSGWKILLTSMNKTEADDVEFELIDVLNSNNIEDAVWCLKCFDYLDYCLFLADVAESVLHIYESEYDSKAPRKAIQGIRDYKGGKITKEELKVLADDAYVVAINSDSDSAYASAYAAAAHSAAFAVTSYEKWNEIKQLFIKHFGV